jgi:starch-binding outer membrane protein, SusD/RagB family
MRTLRNTTRRRGTHAYGSWLSLVAILGLAACDSLLDVDNPNQLVQEDLDNPAAAAALANGALATTARGYSFLILRHDAVSDVLDFIGSRDAWLQLIRGDLRDPRNEFSDEAWPFISEGRWMADEAVRQLRAFRDEGQLGNPVLLAQAKLYSATNYVGIADVFEDFTFSDRMENGPPFGPDNMGQLYTMAIQNLDLALPIAQAAGDRSLETAILAQRARARQGLQIWQGINPPGQTPTDPLVNDAAMVADAQAALARAPDNDWDFRFRYSASTVTNNWGAWVNERAEMRLSEAYATRDGDVTVVTKLDPIDGVPAPALVRRANQIARTATASPRQFGDLTVTSSREMHLILAEAALAVGNEEGFAEHINNLRALDGLTPWTGQVDALELLIDQRRANLLSQGRTLSDHYRFGTRSFLWASSSEAFQRPGTKLPITQIELTSNCHLLGTC